VACHGKHLRRGRGAGRAALMATAVVAAIFFGLVNAWVLLVEIMR